MAHLIYGKPLADSVLKNLKSQIHSMAKRPPGLATILVGHDPASAIYVANKRKRAMDVGIASFHYDLETTVDEASLLKLIDDLNKNHAVDGILVQLPLPKSIREARILEAVSPTKDVDGFHPLNMGHLMRGEPTIVACTPLGIMELIKSVNYDLKGRHAVVVGKSNIVGKPCAQLLLNHEATVTVCHSNTKDLASITRQADILVVAAGKPKLITEHHVKAGVFVIDVGINRDEQNRICGDVDFDAVVDKASYITPVPGGVGPLTIAMLLKNTVDNYMRSQA